MELAKRTRFLRNEIIPEELIEAEAGKGFILGFYEAFREYLKETPLESRNSRGPPKGSGKFSFWIEHLA
jgi:hypothetical protein